MERIIFEKYCIENNKNELLNAWTKVFNNLDEVINYINENKNYVLSKGYKIVIRSV